MGPTLKKQKINKNGKSINKKTTQKEEKKPKVTIEQEKEEEEESSSESEEEEEEEESELEEQQDSELDEEIGSDDEVDLADVSSSSDDDEDEDESNFPKLKKNKGKSIDDGSESFATALTSIVNSKLKSYDRKDPILVRNKTTLKKLESDKLELKAKKALLQEKKNFQDKYRIKNLLPIDNEQEPGKVRELIQKEKDLKKVAQRGVVKLFNAVLSTQIKTNQELGKEVIRGQTKKEELMNDVSKEKFLDLIAAAGNED
ncbi:Ribosomal RNA-processing protein 15 [Candida tropicalis]